MLSCLKLEPILTSQELTIKLGATQANLMGAETRRVPGGPRCRWAASGGRRCMGAWLDNFETARTHAHILHCGSQQF